MRFMKVLFAAVLLAAPVAALADVNDVPGSAEWYLHVDLEKMKSEDAGKALYGWMREEVFDEVRDEAGIDVDKEISSLTAFSVTGQGPVIVIDGNFSSETRDKLMAIIAAEGDIEPLKASGQTYYRLGDGDELNYNGDDVHVTLDSLDEGAWISMDIRNKILITGAEGQMKSLLANKGRVPGAGKNRDALLVLSAEKTLLQAGMNSRLIDDDGDTDWDSNILAQHQAGGVSRCGCGEQAGDRSQADHDRAGDGRVAGQRCTRNNQPRGAGRQHGRPDGRRAQGHDGRGKGQQPEPVPGRRSGARGPDNRQLISAWRASYN